MLHLQIVERLAQRVQNVGRHALALALLQRVLQRHELLGGLAEGFLGLCRRISSLAGEHALGKLHELLRVLVGLRRIHVLQDGLGAHQLQGARGFLLALR